MVILGDHQLGNLTDSTPATSGTDIDIDSDFQGYLVFVAFVSSLTLISFRNLQLSGPSRPVSYSQ